MEGNLAGIFDGRSLEQSSASGDVIDACLVVAGEPKHEHLLDQ